MRADYYEAIDGDTWLINKQVNCFLQPNSKTIGSSKALWLRASNTCLILLTPSYK